LYLGFSDLVHQITGIQDDIPLIPLRPTTSSPSLSASSHLPPPPPPPPPADEGEKLAMSQSTLTLPTDLPILEEMDISHAVATTQIPEESSFDVSWAEAADEEDEKKTSVSTKESSTTKDKTEQSIDEKKIKVIVPRGERRRDHQIGKPIMIDIQRGLSKFGYSESMANPRLQRFEKTKFRKDSSFGYVVTKEDFCEHYEKEECKFGK
jgi:hypothetical protein